MYTYMFLALNLSKHATAFCKSNCIFEEGSGCLTCNIGYATEPECCDCDISSNDTHGFYYDTISQECKRKFALQQMHGW